MAAPIPAPHEPPAGFRPVPRQQRHVTLVFVGEEDDWQGVAAACAAVAPRHRAFTLSFARWLGLPTATGARVAALAAESEPRFTALALDLRRALLPFGEVERERRPPRPHVTVGRRRAPAALPEEPLLPAWTWPVTGFALLASELTPEGAVYTELASFVLPQG